MDISDALSILKYLVPVPASWVVFRFAKRIHSQWLRRAIRALSSTFFVIGAVNALLILTVQVGCSRHAPPIYSPDRHYVAVLSYALQGALGDDYANVAVRPSWMPWATNVYSGLGWWDFKNNKPGGPEVRWLDGTHLLIRYYDDRTGKEGRGGPPTCLTRIGIVQIECEPLRRGASE